MDRLKGRILLGLAIAVAGAGCKEKGPAPDAEPLARLLPRVSVSPPQEQVDEPLGRIRVTGSDDAGNEQSGFSADQPGGKLVSLDAVSPSGPTHALCVDIEGTRGVGISVAAIRKEVPGALESSNVVRAIIYHPYSRTVVVRAEVRSGAEAGAVVKGYSQWVTINYSAGVQVIDFALVPPADIAESDRLTFQFSGSEGLAGIAEVQFLRRPAAGLKAPANAPVWTDRPNGSCLAAGLVEGLQWEAAVDVGPDSEIVLWYSVPDELKWLQTPSTRVEVRVRGDGGKMKHSFEAHHAPGWTEVVLPLDDIDPCTATIRFSLHEPRKDYDAIVLIGDLAVRAKQADPKTVVLITSDTHRVDYIGSSLQTPRVETPAIDALARRGLQYGNAFTTTNVTSPSHIAIMTGLHPKDTGIIDNYTQLAERATTLAESFAAAGYRTLAATSVAHLTPSTCNIGQGFDRFSTYASGQRSANEAIKALQPWIDDAEGQNLFVWLHLFDAHTPYESKEQQAAQANPGPDRKLLTREQLVVDVIPKWLTEAPALGLGEVREWYGQEVVDMDSDLRAFLEQPRFARAWIAFTSDHGENLGEHNMWFRHAGLYQPVMYVPLILAGPGIPIGRNQADVQQSQVAATLLNLAGVAHDLPGEDLLSSHEEIEKVRFGLSAHGNQACIASGDWLLLLDLVTMVVQPDVRFFEAGRVQLLDLRLGVTSEADFVESEPEVARRLALRLITWLETKGDDPLAETSLRSPSEDAQLRELGYASAAETTIGAWWKPEKITAERWLTFHGIER